MSTETKPAQKRTSRRKTTTETSTDVAISIPLDDLNGGGLVDALTEADTDVTEDEVLEGELITETPSNTTSTRVVRLGAVDSESTMFTERTVPWMKLGKLKDGVATASDAAVLSGLDFKVEAAKTGYFDEKEQAWIVMDNRKTIIREDTRMPMSIVSSDYPILQYGDAFDFMDSINSEYVAAGALKGGRQGFMVVKAPESFNLNVLDGDKHEMYMVLRTSHDLTRAVEVAVMPLRMRCMNQLTLRSFTAGVEHRWTIRHTSTMHEKLAEANASLQKMNLYVDSFKANTERLAGVQVSQDRARTILRNVLPDRPKTEEKINSIIALWQSSDTVGYTDNGWGFINAVSEYYDWGRSGGNPESRFTAALQGQTFTAINKVTTRVLSMA